MVTGASGKTGRLVVGGDGISWDQVVLENVALDYVALGSAIQPRELHPPRFEITDLSLENLKSEAVSEGVPDSVLEKLEGIKNQSIVVGYEEDVAQGEEAFVELLKTAIGEEQTAALKFWIVKHALHENILTPPLGGEEGTNIFGFSWYHKKTGIEIQEGEIGRNPRFWEWTDTRPPKEIIDGDPRSASTMRELVTGPEYNALGTLTYGAWEMGYGILERAVYNLDLAIPLPVNRIRFYPRQQALDRRGIPNKRNVPEAYEVSVCLHPQEFLLLGSESYPYHSLDHVIERTMANSKSMVDLTIPVELVRFVRINLSLMRQAYSFAEIEVYGEGFPPITSYTSAALDFGEPVNFGRIFWKFTKFRRTPDGGEIPDPGAPVRLILETRSGLDDSPLAYYVVSELGGQKEVTEKEYRRATPRELRGTDPVDLPGRRSGVVEDVENWGLWSSPYDPDVSGEDIRSPDGRRFLQFRFTVESDDVFAFGRLDSVAFECAPLLVGRVLGEVSLSDQPTPPGGVTEVPAGVDTTFVYDIRAEFDASDQSGFDGVRIDVPSETEFLRLEMGEPYIEVPRDSVSVEISEYLLVTFPSHKITRQTNTPVRVTFRTMVLTSGTYFTGNVFDTGSDNLSQSINPGDANPEVSTNKIQVFVSESALRTLSDVVVSPAVITPNDDDQNDQARISFRILGVKSARVTIEIYDSSGRKVKTLVSDPGRPRGSYTETWDAMDREGQQVAPGVYLCKVAAHTESGVEEKTIPLVVVY
jgi:hypothetical protein